MYRQLQKEVENIFDVPYEAAAEYERNMELLVNEVNRVLESREDILTLIGENPLEVMEENHNNHARFMLNVFKLNQQQLLLDTLPWVYRTYRVKGFSYDYFPVALQTWKEAVNTHLEPHLASPLCAVYQWMVDRHESFVSLSLADNRSSTAFEREEWKTVNQKFISALLKGDHQQCLKMAEEEVNSRADLENFYLQVLQPVLYRIGKMWEQGEISVAHEHLASAIVSRVMASLYPGFILIEEKIGNAVLTASPNEFHEIGARMVADLLEIDGWDVKYLGANTPRDSLLEILEEDPPDLLGVSIAMPFNLETARDLIHTVKSSSKLKETVVMVGGKVLAENPGLWKVTGADMWAAHGKEAAYLATKARNGETK